MCLAVYLGAHSTFPQGKRGEPNGGFYLEETADSDPVRRQFRTPHVYYAGSHEGCGCGFVTSHEDEDTPRDLESVEALARTTLSALDAGEVELFVCWEGEQEAAEVETHELVEAGFSEGLRDFLNDRAHHPARLCVHARGL